MAKNDADNVGQMELAVFWFFFARTCCLDGISKVRMVIMANDGDEYGEDTNFPLRDVLYGWCGSCRESHFAEYKKVEG